MFELFLETTPDTTGYMYLGYGVFFGVMILYLGSLILRHRNLQQDLETLKEIEDQSS